MHASSVAAGLRGAGRYLNNKYKRGFHPLMAGWCEIEEGGAGRGGEGRGGEGCGATALHIGYRRRKERVCWGGEGGEEIIRTSRCNEKI